MSGSDLKALYLAHRGEIQAYLDRRLRCKETAADLTQDAFIRLSEQMGRTRIDNAFAQRHLTPRIVLEAIDSDVIKTYVRLGLGVGIVAEMAVSPGSDPDLVTRPLGQLFGQNVARIALKRGAYLRDFVYQFASLLSDRLDKALILKAMSGQSSSYEL